MWLNKIWRIMEIIFGNSLWGVMATVAIECGWASRHPKMVTSARSFTGASVVDASSLRRFTVHNCQPWPAAGNRLPLTTSMKHTAHYQPHSHWTKQFVNDNPLIIDNFPTIYHQSIANQPLVSMIKTIVNDCCRFSTTIRYIVFTAKYLLLLYSIHCQVSGIKYSLLVETISCFYFTPVSRNHRHDHQPILGHLP